MLQLLLYTTERLLRWKVSHRGVQLASKARDGLTAGGSTPQPSATTVDYPAPIKAPAIAAVRSGLYMFVGEASINLIPPCFPLIRAAAFREGFMLGRVNVAQHQASECRAPN